MGNEAPPFRSGLISLIGKPNVGKSTLLNALVGEPIAIVSRKPETTRHRILGIRHLPNGQLVFVDTPGFRKPVFLLDREMMQVVKASLESVELILAVFQAFGFDAEDRRLLSLLPSLKRKAPTPVFAVINKIDRVEKQRLLPMIAEAQASYPFREIIPVSALTGEQMEVLFENIVSAMPEGPPYYPGSMKTDQDEARFIREWIREAILERTHQEVPHSVAVSVEEMTEKKAGVWVIRATLFVERASQKAILIGAQGKMLKAIGERARRALEARFGKRIFLELWVKVLKDWRQDPEALRRLGYRDTP